MAAVHAGATKVRVVGPAGMLPIKELFFNGVALRTKPHVNRNYTIAAHGTDVTVEVPTLKRGMLIVGATLTDGSSRVAHVTVQP